MVGGGLLVVACFGGFLWFGWRGRDPAPLAISSIAGSARVEIKVHIEGAVVKPGVYRLAQGDRVEDAIRAAGGLAPEADTGRLNLAQRVRDEQRLDIPFLPPGRPTVSTGAAAPGGSVAGAAQAAPEEAPAAAVGAVGAVPAESGPVDPGAQGVPQGQQSGPGHGAEVVQAPRATATTRPASTPRPTATVRAATTPRPTAFSGGRVNVNTATQAELEQLPGLGEASARRILQYRAANGPLRSLDDVRRAGVSDALVRRAADYLAFE